MFGQFTAFTRQFSTRRLAQSGLITRGFEEFFEAGQRLPTKKIPTGRAWEASELRQKSWEDLHKLWYVVLKERNILASQAEEAKRLGISSQFFTNKGRMVKCKKTMARIKTVLNERRLAWEKAQQTIIQQQKKNTKIIGAEETKPLLKDGESALQVPELMTTSIPTASTTTTAV
ncbi:54S ribosomal protein L4 mitochondrial [Coemansia spiralis]|uniref:Large ribosomal subunit protein uL29m n=2 Tax=Coemansia TaxID=4863 RepID=A0A9W8G684_9FUNG|nr:mitochondrial 39-S ribosomal protein L47 (MRP-L47)-domain-containing protein [Coemansia spiralis]KAJ1990090.1 54S ribosomal protein L4 mitochondrial [Coemansia umbellata]KAJ2623822.1 54S ribosomal protein L4 mitochondrial [Coemansia sp. RSA 1358]KAJ2675287.1 54S ribosomal protein L4 mitochondrial [Coemansia spiralis]